MSKPGASATGAMSVHEALRNRQRNINGIVPIDAALGTEVSGVHKGGFSKRGFSKLACF